MITSQVKMEKCKVLIHDDFIDKSNVDKILKNVSKIVSGAYERKGGIYEQS